jgi:hypothetical protein
MTIDQFRLLDEMEKVSAILKFGRLINQTMENHQRVFHYRIDSFFVSAIYSSPGGELVEISCFLEISHFISVNPAEREYEVPEI